MTRVLQAMSDVVRQYTGRTARAYNPLDMLISYMMESLARPGRQIQIVREDNGIMLVDVLKPPPALPVPSHVLAAADCPSMFSPGSCWLSKELRRMLETPSDECPDEGVYNDLHLPMVGPLFV
jgi:hypothetical protein